MLSPDDRVRFARHLLLPEIGEQGQLRLLASRAALPPDAEPVALEHARDYLERAGLAVDDDGAVVAPLPTAARPSDPFPEATALMRGAFAAVETIKAALDLGTPGDWSRPELD